MVRVGEQPEYWAKAVAFLGKDECLRAVMDAHPVGFLKGRGDALGTLLRSITGQQISVKAADSVWGKFVEKVGEVTAEKVLALGEDELKKCGFSGSKVRYVRGVCAGFVDGTVHPGLWEGMGDDEIIQELVKLPGIGRWTAEMFLIFHLLRPDVLPVDDLGLVKGFKLAYAGRWKTKVGLKKWQERLRREGEKWRPYRSVATWYLWRSLDPVEVSY
jgi:DNA-3-methyladenine glycosylase II